MDVVLIKNRQAVWIGSVATPRVVMEQDAEKALSEATINKCAYRVGEYYAYPFTGLAEPGPWSGCLETKCCNTEPCVAQECSEVELLRERVEDLKEQRDVLQEALIKVLDIGGAK
jgi:hypothetical protein